MNKKKKYLNIEELQQKLIMDVEEDDNTESSETPLSKHNCPKCKEPLSKINYGKLSLDKCQYCQGFWLKETQLEHICEHFTDKQLEKLESIGKVKDRKKTYKNLFHFDSRYECPYCTTKLRQVYFQLDSNILLDICDRCQGVFYDHKKLKTVINLIRGKNT